MKYIFAVNKYNKIVKRNLGQSEMSNNIKQGRLSSQTFIATFNVDVSQKLGAGWHQICKSWPSLGQPNSEPRTLRLGEIQGLPLFGLVWF